MNSTLTTSFGIPFNPDHVFRLFFASEIIDCYKSIDHTKKLVILGSGTNTIISNDLKNFNVLLIQNKELEINEFENSVHIKAGAGIIFDDLVELSVSNNWSGFEALSAIPGTVGASPIQNIGAYGQEVSNLIESVEVFDIENNCMEILSKEKCDFGYRKSRFNSYDKGRYIVLSVNFLLTKNSPITIIPNYPGVSEYLKERNIEYPTLANIRESITNIRWSKLPNPIDIGNTGSFFKNVIIDETIFKKILNEFSDVPQHPIINNQYKLPTGWLIDKVGLKGKNIGPIGFHKNHALVLTNCGNASFNDLVFAINEVKNLVQKKFGIQIEVEPELIY